MRIIIMAVAALLAFAGAIHAQIAAPRLNPVVIESDAPFNPATLPWSGASRVGAGLIDVEGDVSDVGPPATTTEVSGDGATVQGRWVGENFAIAAEAFNLELDLLDDTVETDATMVSLALKLGEAISVGIGQQELEETETDKATNASTVFTVTLPMAGATLRLAEVLYIGAVIGEQTFERSVGGQSIEDDSTVTRVGVAYYWRDGPNGLHLEAYREEQDPTLTPTPPGFDNPALPAGTVELESEADGFTVEVLFANILIGFESLTTDFIRVNNFPSIPFVRTVVGEEEETTISVGWAPEEGLAITVAATETEQSQTVNGLPDDASTFDSLFLGAAWLF